MWFFHHICLNVNFNPLHIGTVRAHVVGDGDYAPFLGERKILDIVSVLKLTCADIS